MAHPRVHQVGFIWWILNGGKLPPILRPNQTAFGRESSRLLESTPTIAVDYYSSARLEGGRRFKLHTLRWLPWVPVHNIHSAHANCVCILSSTRSVTVIWYWVRPFSNSYASCFSFWSALSSDCEILSSSLTGTGKQTALRDDVV